jgi:hypothetical protein
MAARGRRRTIATTLLIVVPFAGLVACFDAQERGGGRLAETLGLVCALALVPGIVRLIEAIRQADASGIDAATMMRAHRRLIVLAVVALAVAVACAALLDATVPRGG